MNPLETERVRRMLVLAESVIDEADGLPHDRMRDVIMEAMERVTDRLEMRLRHIERNAMQQVTEEAKP